jgi:hypothetical protein
MLVQQDNSGTPLGIESPLVALYPFLYGYRRVISMMLEVCIEHAPRRHVVSRGISELCI